MEDTTSSCQEEKPADVQSRAWVVVNEDMVLKKTLHMLGDKSAIYKSTSDVSLQNRCVPSSRLSSLDGNVEGNETATSSAPFKNVLEFSGEVNGCTPPQLESLDTIIGGNASSSSSQGRDNSKSIGDELFGDDISCDLSDMQRKRQGSFDDGLFLNDADDELLKELLGDDFGKSFETSPYNEMTETSLDLRTPLGAGSVLSETLKPDDSIGLRSSGKMFDSAETSDPALSHGREGPKRPYSGKAAVTSITLCQWIKNNMPQGLCSWDDLNNYILTAIPIAIELARLLVEGDGANFEIVLKSSELSLQARGNDFTHVQVQRSTKTPAVNRMNRLASLGAVLYELFSGLILPSKSADFQPNAGMDEFDLGVNAILNMLWNEDHLSMLRDDASQAKRKAGVPSKSRGAIDQYRHEKIMSCLDDVGLPSSMRCIITNLLDCSQSDFRVDGAYSSFEDVLVDLGLVRDNSECYLRSPGDKPKFSIPNKLYGRQETMDKIANLYACETCNCLVVNGRAGVGKSSLLSQGPLYKKNIMMFFNLNAD